MQERVERDRPQNDGAGVSPSMLRPWAQCPPEVGFVRCFLTKRVS
ncbi:MAG: hypothetical protein BWY44_00897 [Candidatus Omnitrophica bacterium ADurb.Bin292]|nr:MAG: hypothetical protein BWY44_00897 [Candidatus Omnitrophica bacterium ADurb.Bin292]